jgi:hypothetical protein
VNATSCLDYGIVPCAQRDYERVLFTIASCQRSGGLSNRPRVNLLAPINFGTMAFDKPICIRLTVCA